MEKRRQELSRLKAYTNSIEKEVTLLLQNLQWDPKLITEKRAMVTCKYDSNHKIPLDGRDIHEEQCHLTKLGYRKEDALLPDPVDADASTLVKLRKYEIVEIINNAAIHNPLFKRGSQEWEPLTVERLQWAYTAHERRAIHDAVVNTAPLCHDLTDLDLLSSNDDPMKSQKKSRLEILAELRNMKRRRAKYRVAPKTRNYSHVLRDVIKAQMDSYGETTRTIIKTEYGQNVYVSQQVANINTENFTPHGAVIKLERESPETDSYNRSQRDGPRERHRAKSRENRYNDDRKAYRKDIYPSNEGERSYGDRQSRIPREKSKEMKLNESEKRPARDLSRERNYDHQRKDTSDRSREKRYNDSRSSHCSEYLARDRSKNYESYKTKHDMQQERASQEYESHARYTKDHNGDKSKEKRHRDFKNKHWKESAERPIRYGHHKVIKQEGASTLNDSFDNGDTCRKRKSRSKERQHNDKKRRHDQDKHSSKGVMEHERGKKHAVSSEMVIKKERESL